MKWLKNGVGQGFIFYVVIPEHLSFYSDIMFVIKIVVVYEQIIEYRYGGLLEISDKFITESNIFAYFCKAKFNSLENLLTI